MPEQNKILKMSTSDAYEKLYDEPNSKRPAEEFSRCSELLKEGFPSIYQLKASTERTASNEELRWFDIGKPSNSNAKKHHKVLILVGATGSGKSTLVNGMVNYILGVEWGDPFRFCLVKEKDSASQTVSQTKGVTAYTIHHVEGMRINYGITIIDTPGFGDTGGVKRDQEINNIIGRFLSHKQSQSVFKSINAVCLVTRSPEPRLTPTQKYVFKSVVSIFGQDITSSLRLLVTFGDGMKPPVLEAIREANIPGLSDRQDGKIQHQKFNNSALYASNSQNDDRQEALFYNNYWSLGELNFADFFSMLAEMPDQSLQQTLAVNEARTNVERLLKEFDYQLKNTLNKIEDLHKKEAAVWCEKTIEASKQSSGNILREKVPCIPYKMVYNCNTCSKTCSVSLITGPCPACGCSKIIHTFESSEWVERRMEDKFNSTAVMKKEYMRDPESQIKTEQNTLSQQRQELDMEKVKGIDMLRKIGDSLKLLNSFAPSSRKRSIIDHVNNMKLQAEQERLPGYEARNKILDELLAKALKD